ncbi:TIGR03084 family metal-binding protein [Actinocorallia sp. B10E7]|uniref:TIGR03084 family metal-binding protein n=1 Tax=Actinocorallia sp. B10E7 TaxID=3153558 RepID=UPI00325E9E74
MEIFEDLLAEGEELDALVRGLEPERWSLPTPAEGWTVAHQIAHLVWTDRQAVLAATDPEAFREAVRSAPPDLVERGADPSAHPPGGLLEAWRASRAEVVEALRAVPPGGRVPWFGPSMAAPSMATARLMETWAHGQDVADALGADRRPTGRLRHVAHIAVRARDYAFTVNGLTAPEQPFRVVLESPSGDQWCWGPSTASQTVTGPALDFCLLAVRRRHRADLSLAARGGDASRWLDLVQAFAGPPGPGRPPAKASPAASSTH